MANKKRMTRHRALDLAVSACALAARDNYRVHDVDVTRGTPKTAPALRVAGIKRAGAGYVKAVRLLPLEKDGFAIRWAAVSDWVKTCGGERCARCDDKSDCAAEWERWGEC